MTDRGAWMITRVLAWVGLAMFGVAQVACMVLAAAMVYLVFATTSGWTYRLAGAVFAIAMGTVAWMSRIGWREAKQTICELRRLHG